MRCSGKVVVEVHVSTLADFVDETHLEELVDDLEDEIFRVEVLEGVADPLMDRIEGEAACGVAQLLCDEVPELVALVSDLIEVLIGLLLQAVEEAFFFEFIHTLLQELTRVLVAILAQAQLSL